MKSAHLFRQPKDGILCTPSGQHVSDEVLLSIVGGEDGNLVRRVALQPHEHEQRHGILCLSQILRGVVRGVVERRRGREGGGGGERGEGGMQSNLSGESIASRGESQ